MKKKRTPNLRKTPKNKSIQSRLPFVVISEGEEKKTKNEVRIFVFDAIRNGCCCGSGFPFEWTLRCTLNQLPGYCHQLEKK